MKAFQEALQQLVSIVNPLCVLSHNPDHCCPGLRLIQRVEVLTQGGNHALVPRSTIKKKATMKLQKIAKLHSGVGGRLGSVNLY